MAERTVLKIDSLGTGGLGLGRIEGRVVFVPGVLPGEVVAVDVIKERPDYAQARLLEVLEPHPERLVPVCRHFLDCGGCHLMHMPYSLQTRLKVQAVVNNLEVSSGTPAKIVPSPHALFYRDRVRFQVKTIQGRLRLGFYAPGSKRLVQVNFCYQVHPRINMILPALTEWLGRMSGLGEPTQTEILAGLPNEALILILDLNRPPSAKLHETIRQGPHTAEHMHVFFTVKGRFPDRKKSEKLPTVTWLYLPDVGIKLSARPGAFTQINRNINRLIVDELLAACRVLKPGRILDLYAGLGNFSLPVSRLVREVVSVEDNPAAVDNARENARINGIRNIKMWRKDAAKAVKAMADRSGTYDIILLDPPRAGARDLAPRIVRLQPKEIVYISCHPAAMVRDLAQFQSLGFGLRDLTAYDMFPQTAHVEMMARLG